MAAYCEINDLLTWIEEDALTELVSDNPEAAFSDADVTTKLNALITTAGATIDRYLIGRYGSQIRTGEAPLLKQTCAQLAVYYAYLKRRSVDDDWRQNYEDILAWLTDMRDGKGALPEDEAGTETEEPTAEYITDAQKASDDSLNVNDRRYYTPGKQSRLFGLPERS